MARIALAYTEVVHMRSVLEPGTSQEILSSRTKLAMIATSAGARNIVGVGGRRTPRLKAVMPLVVQIVLQIRRRPILLWWFPLPFRSLWVSHPHLAPTYSLWRSGGVSVVTTSKIAQKLI